MSEKEENERRLEDDEALGDPDTQEISICKIINKKEEHPKKRRKKLHNKKWF